MTNSNNRFKGEKRIANKIVRVIETMDGRYLITIETKGLFGSKTITRMFLDNFDEAFKVFNTIL